MAGSKKDFTEEEFEEAVEEVQETIEAVQETIETSTETARPPAGGSVKYTIQNP